VVGGLGTVLGVALGGFYAYLMWPAIGAPEFTVPWPTLGLIAIAVPLLAAPWRSSSRPVGCRRF
jgi:putative ABC transport system permease protein